MILVPFFFWTVCKPCLDGWVLFQSSCYLFSQHQYLSHWRTWDESCDYCKMYQAALAVIESQEEQVSQISFVYIFLMFE